MLQIITPYDLRQVVVERMIYEAEMEDDRILEDAQVRDEQRNKARNTGDIILPGDGRSGVFESGAGVDEHVVVSSIIADD